MSFHAGIYLFQGLPKADKMELGSYRRRLNLVRTQVIPVETKRCVVELDGQEISQKDSPLAADLRECGKAVQAYADPERA